MADAGGRARSGRCLLAGAALLAGCGAGSSAGGAARRHGSTVDPARDARHDARRCDRSRGQGRRDPGVRRARARGLRFRQAYATVPETLPSHASMLTGLYPAGHGVHENARSLPGEPRRCWPSGSRRPAIARRRSCRASCWLVASASRAGFDLSTTTSCPPGRPSGPPAETTDAGRRVSWIRRRIAAAASLWVHYYDPHHPYSPPEPFRSRYAKSPYLGEVAAMDAQLGRLVQAFEQRAERSVGDRRGGRSRRGTRGPRRVSARQAAVSGHHARSAGASWARV